ncbi:MAG: hypothetical protein RLZZ501_2289, partial [Pseudomonadota bacterium]
MIVAVAAEGFHPAAFFGYSAGAMTHPPPTAPLPPLASTAPAEAAVTDAARAAAPFLVAVCNHKGGVAKTTTCLNLALGLAAGGQSVAVADFDSLGTATRALGAGRARFGSYEVLTGRCPLDEVLHPSPQAGVWVVAATANLHLAEVEHEVIGLDARRLRARLGASGRLDTLLIDCPPSLGVIAVNLITAADLVLVPVPPTAYARDALARTLDIIAACRNGRGGPAPRILITMADPDDPAVGAAIERLRQDHRDQVYPTVIPFDRRNEILAADGRILLAAAPDSPTAAAYLHATLALMRDQRRLRPPAVPARPAPAALAPPTPPVVEIA